MNIDLYKSFYMNYSSCFLYDEEYDEFSDIRHKYKSIKNINDIQKNDIYISLETNEKISGKLPNTILE